MNLNNVATKIAIVWGVLFSLNSLSTCIIATLAGSHWATMDLQVKFVTILAMFSNWSGVMMAYLSKTVARLEAGEPPPVNGITTK